MGDGTAIRHSHAHSDPFPNMTAAYAVGLTMALQPNFIVIVPMGERCASRRANARRTGRTWKREEADL